MPLCLHSFVIRGFRGAAPKNMAGGSRPSGILMDIRMRCLPGLKYTILWESLPKYDTIDLYRQFEGANYMSRSKGFLGNLFSRGEHHTD